MKVKFIKKNGSVWALVDTGRSPVAKPRSVRLMLGEQGYPWRVAAENIESFLSANGISFSEVDFGNEEPLSWYSYEVGDTVKKSLSLNPKWVEEWQNYDSPTLYKYTTNQMKPSVNMLGMRFPVFYCTLIETDYRDVTIDDDIEEKEIEQLLKSVGGCVETALRDKLLAKHQDIYTENNRIIEEAEAAMQAVIDKHCNEITDAISQYPTNPCALDCGFTWFYPKSGDLTTAIKKRKAAKSEAPGFLHIRMPYIEQSINAQRQGSDLVCSFIHNETPYEVYAAQELD